MTSAHWLHTQVYFSIISTVQSDVRTFESGPNLVLHRVLDLANDIFPWPLVIQQSVTRFLQKILNYQKILE
jgi:hypothetical protein